MEIRLSCVVSLVAVYIPPNASDEYFDDKTKALRDLTERQHVIILGDFNLPDIHWIILVSDSSWSKEVVYDHGLHQLVNVPTHRQGNILDLVFCIYPDLLVNVCVHDETPVSTDHFTVTFAGAYEGFLNGGLHV